MSKAVLISIKPEWCEKIASGEKTIEVRKTRPKLPTPFKCYIYMTKQKKGEDGWLAAVCAENRCYYGAGSVIGEFVCDRVETLARVGFSGSSEEPKYCVCDFINMITRPVDGILADGCLSLPELETYLAGAVGRAWHISELKIYDTPKSLNEFHGVDRGVVCVGCMHVPPQSWCYVEDVQ